MFHLANLYRLNSDADRSVNHELSLLRTCSRCCSKKGHSCPSLEKQKFAEIRNSDRPLIRGSPIVAGPIARAWAGLVHVDAQCDRRSGLAHSLEYDPRVCA